MSNLFQYTFLGQFCLLWLLNGTLSSCKSGTPKVYYQSEAAECKYFIRDKQKSLPVHVDVSIRNVSGMASDFYITPEGIDLYSCSTLVRSLLVGAEDGESEAIRLWRFVADWTYHIKPISGDDQYFHHPGILVNGLRGGICDDINSSLVHLAEVAGIPSRVYHLEGHVVAEMYYDSSWHMLDADRGIFYRKPTGPIADVRFLEENSNIIGDQTSKMKDFLQRVRNEATKRAIASNENNEVSDFYRFLHRGYNSGISLMPGDEIGLVVTKAIRITKATDLNFLEEEGDLYNRVGKLSSKRRYADLKLEGKKGAIIEQRLPYPITKISIRVGEGAKRSDRFRVYFSIDKTTWYYRGILGGDGREVTFVPFNEYGSPFTLGYYLKLVPQDIEDSLGTHFILDNQFIFSDKILFNNPEGSFKIVSLSGEVKNLDVKVNTR